MTQDEIIEMAKEAGFDIDLPAYENGTALAIKLAKLVAAKAIAELESQEPVAVYGYCPECGAKGVMRERRPDGNDKCANGHTYQSCKAIRTPQRTWVGLAKEDRLCAKYMQDAPDGIEAVIDYIEDRLKQKNGFAEENA
jgi:hypothetical protein